MKKDELLSRLSRLLPAQFEEVMYRLEIPPGDISHSSAPQTTRATEVLRHLTNIGGLKQLEQLLQPPMQEATGNAVMPQSPALTKHTILFLAANPAGTDRLALDREAKAIQVELERSGYRDRFELVTRWAVEPLDLLREMRKLKPTVVHFSGHGGQSGLYFQSETSGAKLVSADALRDAFGAAGSSVKVVVLSSCYSASQADALLAHVDCVVGMSGAILDDAARNFAIGFYGGCGDQESVAAAFKQGCAAISLGGVGDLGDKDLPQLNTRPGVDASQLVLAPMPIRSR